MNFEGPVLLIAGPIIGSLLLLSASRWQRVTALAGIAVTWLLWAMVTAIPLAPTAVEQAHRLFAGDTYMVFGRSLILTEGIRTLVLALLAGLSLIFLLTLAFPQGRHFIPGSLAVLSPLAAALMIDTVAFSALLLLSAMALLVVVIQAGHAGSTRAALRYLIMVVMAVPLFLVAGWMLSPDQVTLLQPASRLLLVGFAILLAGFPFHIWVSPIIDQSPPLVSAFLFGLVQLVVVAFIYDILHANTWLQQNDQFVQMLAQIAAATAVVAGLLALVATDLNRLWASLLSLDMGLALLTLTISDLEGWNMAVAMQIARFLSLLLLAAGISLLRREPGQITFAASRGLWSRKPWAVALFGYGAISLLGLPLTIGFSGRWAIIQTVQQASRLEWLPYILLPAMLAATLGILRSVIHFFSPAGDEPEAEQVAVDDTTQQSQIMLLANGVAGLLLAMGILLALFPKLLSGYAQSIALW